MCDLLVDSPSLAVFVLHNYSVLILPSKSAAMSHLYKKIKVGCN